ncbi:serine hydroxymethyltransferase, partial [Halomonas maura]|nr:serine hydroxymethyltransferase [Halomonas maura]
WICDILDTLAAETDTTEVESEVRGKVAELCDRHPVYAKAVAEQAGTTTA